MKISMVLLVSLFVALLCATGEVGKAENKKLLSRFNYAFLI